MDKESLQITITLLGVLCMGGFVGFLLSLAINFSSTVNLKVLSALMGAALGGAPILFMQGLGFEKWMYPIGLVMGLLWLRIVRARWEKRLPIFAWIDTVLILLITLIVIVLVVLVASGIIRK
jgi:hypothetical protein